MSIVLKMVVLVLSLGIDTLMMSMSLAVSHNKNKLKIAIVFACFEAIMPLAGLLVGKTIATTIGHWASVAGGILLLFIAGWLIFFESEDEEGAKLERGLVGWTLVFTALSISLDELAIGFSIGLVGVPIALTIVLIALQSFIFTTLGLKFGVRWKPHLGEWSEKLAAIILALLGFGILANAIFPFVRL
jgi:manganese efflux pump family protein